MRRILAFWVFATLLISGVSAQNVQIKGVVVHEKTGVAIPGATITQTGTTNSATADSNGTFSLTVDSSTTILEVLAKGFTDKIVHLAQPVTELTIRLAPVETPPVIAPSQAGGSKIRIFGKVTDEKDSSAMIGVTVLVRGTTNGARTDLDGNYELFVEPGTHMLEFSFVGYEKRSNLITVLDGKEKQVDMLMGMTSREMDIIVVTGNKTSKRLVEEVTSMEVLGAQVINQQNAKMDEAMNKVPGVNMLGKTISIRGGSGFSDATGNRVLALLDEVPIISPENGSIVWEMMPIEVLDQVEVIKGSSSALYGSSALNGVINFRTVQPKDEMVNKVLINYGVYDQPRQRTWNQWWHRKVINQRKDTVDRVVHPMFGGGQFLHAKQYGALGVVLAGSYQQDQGFRQNNDYKRVRLAAKLRYIPKKMQNLTAGLNMTFFHQTAKDFFASQGIATYMYIPTEVVLTRFRFFTIDPYVNYYDKKDNRHSLKFRVFSALTNSTTGDSTEATQFYYDYSFHRNFKKAGVILTAGSNGFYSLIKGKTFGDLVPDIKSIKYFGTRDVLNFAGYVQVEKKFFEKLTLSGGLRLEFAQLSDDVVRNRLPLINLLNRIKDKHTNLHAPVTPLFRFGLNYQATKGTFIRASFGQGFRYPAMSEKYVYTIRSGAQVFPNPDLRPENGWSAEVGIKQGLQVSKWTAYFDLSGFIMRYHDMIEFQVIQNLPDTIIPYGIPFRAENITDARIMGLEFSAVAQGQIFGVPLNFLVGYTYLDPRNLAYDPSDPNSTKLLKNRIQHSAKADIQATYKGLILGLSCFYNSYMKEVDNLGIGALKVVNQFRKTHSKGDFVMDIRTGYNYKNKFTFTFLVKNIFNREYMLRPALIEAPRNYTFQVGYNF